LYAKERAEKLQRQAEKGKHGEGIKTPVCAGSRVRWVAVFSTFCDVPEAVVVGQFLAERKY
jgi:hypothetical protein